MIALNQSTPYRNSSTGTASWSSSAKFRTLRPRNGILSWPFNYILKKKKKKKKEKENKNFQSVQFKTFSTLPFELHTFSKTNLKSIDYCLELEMTAKKFQKRKSLKFKFINPNLSAYSTNEVPSSRREKLSLRRLLWSGFWSGKNKYVTYVLGIRQGEPRNWTIRRRTSKSRNQLTEVSSRCHSERPLESDP